MSTIPSNFFTPIFKDNLLHAKFLNSLSYLENRGAQMIARCEKKIPVTLDILQHAAEEFRHAYFLKMQLEKLFGNLCPTYAAPYLLGGSATKYYLDRLNAHICRLLKNSYPELPLPLSAYVLVTYAIEIRASIFYPIYSHALQSHNIAIRLQPLIAEEEHHLLSIKTKLKSLYIPDTLIILTLNCENSLFNFWVEKISRGNIML